MAASRVATQAFTGSFVNGSATVAAVKALAPAEFTVIAMGHEAHERCTEDDLCREWLIAALIDRPLELGDLPARLQSAPAAAEFFDPLADWALRQDCDLCTDVDSVGFAVCLAPSALGRPVLRRHA